MTLLLARARVVLTAAPTYLVAVASLLPLIAGDLASVMPGQAETITHVALIVGGWLTAAVSIIRRVTPVARAQRGLLDESGAVSLTEVCLVLITVVLILWALGEVPR